MLNISHISDTHGKRPAPDREADLVIITGDCEPNHIKYFKPGYKMGGVIIPATWDSYNYRIIDKEKEGAHQERWWVNDVIPRFKKLGIKLENVVVAPGNHTFCNLTKIFPNAIDKGAKSFMWRGIKIGLLTGVLPLHGEWFDEIEEYDFRQRILELDKDINILVSHCPPYGIQDIYYDAVHGGSQELTRAIFGSKLQNLDPYFTNLWLHCYGHSHGSRGKKVFEMDDGYNIIFSNAATTKNRIKLDIPEKYYQL